MKLFFVALCCVCVYAQHGPVAPFRSPSRTADFVKTVAGLNMKLGSQLAKRRLQQDQCQKMELDPAHEKTYNVQLEACLLSKMRGVDLTGSSVNMDLRIDASCLKVSKVMADECTALGGKLCGGALHMAMTIDTKDVDGSLVMAVPLPGGCFSSECSAGDIGALELAELNKELKNGCAAYQQSFSEMGLGNSEVSCGLHAPCAGQTYSDASKPTWNVLSFLFFMFLTLCFV